MATYAAAGSCAAAALDGMRCRPEKKMQKSSTSAGMTCRFSSSEMRSTAEPELVEGGSTAW